MSVSDWLPVVGWTIPALGWYIANRQANERELRKEVRAEIEEVVTLVGDILKSLKEYLALDGTNEASLSLNLEIQHMFRRLDTLIDLLSKRERPGLDDFSAAPLLNLSEVKLIQTKFFNACTGDDFGDDDREKLSGQALATSWLRCSHIGHQLLDRLHRQFIFAFK